MWEAGSVLRGRFEEKGEGVKSFWRIGNRNGIGCLGMLSSHLRGVAINLK